jgi:hypothetical protein
VTPSQVIQVEQVTAGEPKEEMETTMVGQVFTRGQPDSNEVLPPRPTTIEAENLTLSMTEAHTEAMEAAVGEVDTQVLDSAFPTRIDTAKATTGESEVTAPEGRKEEPGTTMVGQVLTRGQPDSNEVFPTRPTNIEAENLALSMTEAHTEAMEAALSRESLFIHGPPGTQKTQTLDGFSLMTSPERFWEDVPARDDNPSLAFQVLQQTRRRGGDRHQR